MKDQQDTDKPKACKHDWDIIGLRGTAFVCRKCGKYVEEKK